MILEVWFFDYSPDMFEADTYQVIDRNTGNIVGKIKELAGDQWEAAGRILASRYNAAVFLATIHQQRAVRPVRSKDNSQPTLF